MLKLPLSLVLAAGALALTPAGAAATTWCFPDASGCPAGVTGTPTANVETAASTNRSDGIADTIHLSAGSTYTDTNSLNPTGTDALTIVGTGTSSVLTTSSNVNLYVVNAANAASAPITLRDLRIVAPPSLPDNQGAALQIQGDVVDGVDIDVQNPGSGAIPSAVDGNTIDGVHIYATGAGSVYTGISPVLSSGNATVVVEDTLIEDATIGIAANVASIPLDIRRTTVVDPVQSGISASSGGSATVRNSVVHVNSTASALIAVANSAAGATITADHVTLVKSAGNAAAVSALVLNAAGNGNASVTVTNSIFDGYAEAWLRSAPTSAGVGNASIAISWSNHSGTGSTSGDGSTNVATGNINADPLFAGASDYRLTAGSPSADTGDPAGSAGFADRDGNPRVVDGDADCVPRTDMGAYERQTGQCQGPALSGSPGALAYTAGAAPTPVDPAIAIADPDTATMVSAVVTLTNPQAGDQLGYETTGGVAGTVGAGKDSVTFAATPKAALTAALAAVTYRSASADPPAATRVVSFRVNDGNADSNLFTRSIDVTATAAVVPAPGGVPSPGGDPGSGGDPGPAADATAPVLTLLRRSGGSLTYQLSEPALVVLRFARRAPGRRAKGRCRAPSRANRRGKPCRRFVARGKAVPTGVLGGNAVAIPTTLASGTYRVTAVATDAAGNRSAAARITFRLRRAGSA